MKHQESGELTTDEFDTVLLAIGREPCTSEIGLENVKVELAKNGKVVVNEKEETNVDGVYAIGDILLNRLELTPVAIQGMCCFWKIFKLSTIGKFYQNIFQNIFFRMFFGTFLNYLFSESSIRSLFK